MSIIHGLRAFICHKSNARRPRNTGPISLGNLLHAMNLDKLFWLRALVYLPAFCLAKRNWHDTGGTIVMEEAWTIPELLFQQSYVYRIHLIQSTS
jgi:hypothetical protein